MGSSKERAKDNAVGSWNRLAAATFHDSLKWPAQNRLAQQATGSCRTQIESTDASAEAKKRVCEMWAVRFHAGPCSTDV